MNRAEKWFSERKNMKERRRKRGLCNCYVDTERKLFLERKKRDRDSSVIVDHLHSQKVGENSKRSPGRDRLFIERIVLLPPSLIPPSVYRFSTCMQSRGAARAALARHEEELCWCRSDRLPSVSTGFCIQRYSSDPPF